MARNIFSHHYDHCHLNEEEFLKCCLQNDKLCKILVPNVFRIPKPLEEKHRPLLRWKRIRSNLGPGLRQNFGIGIVPNKEEVVHNSFHKFSSKKEKRTFGQFGMIAEEDKDLANNQ